MEQVWLDVQKWTGLQGNFHPFTDVVCAAPEPLPEVVGDWQQWATAYLDAVATHEGRQPGRYHYHYRAEQRDDGGHTLAVFARGTWERTA